MSKDKAVLAGAAGLVFCVVLIWHSGFIEGGEKRYELEPQISIPEYRTDAARAIDAYERLMERYMDLTEGNLARMGRDIEVVIAKLDQLDSKLSRLSARIARIEKAMGIGGSKPPAKKKPGGEGPAKKSGSASSAAR